MQLIVVNKQRTHSSQGTQRSYKQRTTSEQQYGKAHGRIDIPDKGPAVRVGCVQRRKEWEKKNTEGSEVSCTCRRGRNSWQ